MNGKIFFETLKSFENTHPELSNIIKEINEPTEESTYFSLDLSPSKQKLLENFFDTGNNKFEFAKKYSEKINNEYKIPEWIEDIRKLY